MLERTPSSNSSKKELFLIHISDDFNILPDENGFMPEQERFKLSIKGLK